MYKPTRQDTSKYVMVSTVGHDPVPEHLRVRGAQRSPRFYKPVATRTPCLLLVLGAVMICVALLEIVLHQGIKYTNPNDDLSGIQRIRARRQETSETVTVSSTNGEVTSVTAYTSTTIVTTGSDSLTLTSSENQETSMTASVQPTDSSVDDADLLTLVSSTTTQSALTNTDDDYLTLTSSSTPTGITSLTTTTSDGGYSTLTSSPTVTTTEIPGSYLTLSSSSTATAPAANFSALSSATAPDYTSTQTPGAYLTITSPESSDPVKTTGGYLTLTSPDPRTPSLTSTEIPGDYLTIASTQSTLIPQTSRELTISESTADPGAQLTITSSTTKFKAPNPPEASPLGQTTITFRKPPTTSPEVTQVKSTSHQYVTEPSFLTLTSSMGGSQYGTTSSASVKTGTNIPGSYLSIETSSTNALRQTIPSAGHARTSTARKSATSPGAHSSLTASSGHMKEVDHSMSVQVSTTLKHMTASSAYKEVFAKVISGLTILETLSNHPITSSGGSTKGDTVQYTTIYTSTVDESDRTSFYYLVVETTIPGPETTTATGTESPRKSTKGVTVHYTTILTTTVDEAGHTSTFYLVMPDSSSGPENAALTGKTSVDATVSSSAIAGTRLAVTASATVPAASSSLPSNSFTASLVKIKGTFTKADYFYALYLGPFISVFLKVIWDIVYASTKMMEPFYQLAKPEGASAQESLLADFLCTGLSWSSIKTMFHGHWVMMLVTMIYIVIGLLPSFAAESMDVKPQSTCATPLSTHQPCNPAWVVDALMARILEAMLVFTAVMIATLTVVTWRRRSGVFSNPSSIASMTALLSHRGVIEDFRRIDPQSDTETLGKSLAGSSYILSYYETSPGELRYGVVKRNTLLSPKESRSSLITDYQALSNPSNDSTVSQKTSIPWTRILEVIFALSILALFGIVLAYYLDGKDDPFNDFFNSDTFGPRFILTLAASLLDTQWKRLEREVRIMAPYRRLSKRMALPKTTILHPMNGTPLTSFMSALWSGNLFHAFVALIAILSDFLIIGIAGVPFSGGQVKQKVLASCYISMGILGLMLVALIAIWLWRLDNPKMPREPDSLASVWMYLCGSRMVGDFEGMEEVGASLRDAAVKRSGRRYWCGRGRGLDGRNRWMVDMEIEGNVVNYG